MKKLLAILLTLAMVMSMAVVVSADDFTAPTGEEIVYSKSLNVDVAGKFTNISYNNSDFTAAIQKDGATVYVVTDTTEFKTWTRLVLQRAGGNYGANYGSATAPAQTTNSDGTVILKIAGSTLISDFENVGYTVEEYGVQFSINTSDTLHILGVYVTVPETASTPHISSVDFSADAEIANRKDTDLTMLVTSVVIPEAITFEEGTFMVKWYSGDELLTYTIRKTNRTQAFSAGGLTIPTLVYGDTTHDAVDGWFHASWKADLNKVPTKVELWINGELVDTYDFAENAENADVTKVQDHWTSKYIDGTTSLEGNVPTEETPSNPTYTGYFPTSDETHAIIIGDAIITSNHEFNANGDCIYCGYHKDIVEEEVVIETPVESTEEEVDTDDVDNETVEVEDKTEDTNPTTGIALAIVPMMVAAAAVVASKRR